jgi:adenine-specific DNA-methyltransferase
MEKLDGKSLDLTKENIKVLKKLFPEVVTEGKIDFEKLKLVLGEEIETSNEKYEFTWHGKAQSLKLAQTPSTGTLRPDKESSKNWDTTENLYIEGDNLEVLKLLQKAYFGKIKMIYIDPPYNTGKDFVYKDNFRDNIQNYKEITGQMAKINTETNGRYHTDWLNMMYPRLKLARNLLTDDGVIFISIDNNENSNLRKICDEIFGEMNYIEEIIWQKKFSPQNDAKYFSLNHESLLCYAKSKSSFSRNLLPMTEEQKSRYKNPDNDPRGPWTSGDISVGRITPKDIYPIKTPSGREVFPPSGNSWRYSKEKIQELIADNRIWFGESGDNVPRVKRFLSETNRGMVPISLWFHDEVGHTQSAAQDLKKLFNDKAYFNYPKPVNYIKKALILSTNSNDIILDFFSGSATTAHATMQLNAEDGGNRKFIMVQLPEPLDEKSEAYKDGYRTICDIGEERIRRAGDKIVEETGKTDLDIGFKVFKLDSSNIKAWDPETANLEQNLFDLKDNIKEGRTKEDLLYEILLKIGIPLTTPVEEVNIGGKTIYNVGSGAVLLCLEDKIDLNLVNEIIKLKPKDFDSRVIFKETGFLNDSVKTNAIQTLKKNGIMDVRSV